LEKQLRYRYIHKKHNTSIPLAQGKSQEAIFGRKYYAGRGSRKNIFDPKPFASKGLQHIHPK
jgi:hypothetical protein